MRTLVRLLLIIPFALLTAMGASFLFLSVAAVVSPDLAAMIFGALGALGDAVFGLAIDGVDPSPLAAQAAWRGFQFAVAALVAPVVLTALATELLSQRSALLQIALSGLIAAILPLALLGLSRAPSGAEMRVIAALFLTGATAGAVYWLIAGRDAGREPVRAAPLSGPPASSGS